MLLLDDRYEGWPASNPALESETVNKPCSVVPFPGPSNPMVGYLASQAKAPGGKGWNGVIRKDHMIQLFD
jgi:hypothetical protein